MSASNAVIARLETARRLPEYLLGMIQNAKQCEKDSGGTAVIRLGTTGTQGMPSYWIMYINKDNKRASFEGYSYVNNPFANEGRTPRENDGWTDEHLTLEELEAYASHKGVI